MRAPRASVPARALPWLLACSVGAAATVASAAEEWPPRTPPRVPSAAAPAPAPAAPPLAPARVVEPPPAPEPEPVRAAASSSDAVVTTVRAAPRPSEPVWGRLAGLTENRFFARTPGNALVLFPGGLLNVDARSFQTGNPATPDDGLVLNRARLELAGLVGGVVGFNAGADFTHGPSLRGVDQFLSVAPLSSADRLIVQAGQFDAPFTLDNRVSDRSFDFLERSALARSFAIPQNKRQGAMAHGTNPARNFYYAAGGFFGDGQTDAMGRGWVAPFSFGKGPELLRAVTVGGSAWLGQARSGSTLAAQTTQSGFVFFEPSTRWLDGAAVTDVALRTRGTMNALAVEVNVPVRHKYGARFEWATKHQPLDVVATPSAGMPVVHGGAKLDGWAAYGEAWFWAYGDDRILGETGLQLPTRLGAIGLQRPLPGLMLAVRLDYLNETLSPGTDPAIVADVVSRGTTNLTAVTAGANVWLARRLRATLNYAWNHPSGSSVFLTSLTDGNIHELALRLSLAL